MTVLFYLNDVEEGGETAFPVADNATFDTHVKSWKFRLESHNSWGFLSNFRDQRRPDQNCFFPQFGYFLGWKVQDLLGFRLNKGNLISWPFWIISFTPAGTPPETQNKLVAALSGRKLGGAAEERKSDHVVQPQSQRRRVAGRAGRNDVARRLSSGEGRQMDRKLLDSSFRWQTKRSQRLWSRFRRLVVRVSCFDFCGHGSFSIEMKKKKKNPHGLRKISQYLHSVRPIHLFSILEDTCEQLGRVSFLYLSKNNSLTTWHRKVDMCNTVHFIATGTKLTEVARHVCHFNAMSSRKSNKEQNGSSLIDTLGSKSDLFSWSVQYFWLLREEEVLEGRFRWGSFFLPKYSRFLCEQREGKYHQEKKISGNFRLRWLEFSRLCFIPSKFQCHDVFSVLPTTRKLNRSILHSLSDRSGTFKRIWCEFEKQCNPT